MRYYKIILGDSRQMAEVPNASVKMGVCSPPYCTLDVFSKDGEQGSEGDLSRYHTFKSFFQEISKTWAEVYRVLEPGGVLVVQWEDFPPGSRYYGYPREICLVGPMVQSVEKSGLALISRWIVRKFEQGAASAKCQWTMYGNLSNSIPRAVPNTSYAFAFYKPTGGYEIPKKKLDFTRAEWAEWCDGLWNIPFTGSGLDISGGATYPVEFAKRCMKIYSNPGDMIISPFLGTGTDMVAAYELGRNCIGYEVLPRMLPTIKAKVQYGTQDMFSPVYWETFNRYTGETTHSGTKEESK